MIVVIEGDDSNRIDPVLVTRAFMEGGIVRLPSPFVLEYRGNVAVITKRREKRERPYSPLFLGLVSAGCFILLLATLAIAFT